MKVKLQVSIMLCALFINSSYAVVATQDINITSQQAQDKATVASYISNIVKTTSKINQTMGAVDSLKKLDGLQKLNAMSDLCTTCTTSDIQQLYDYSTSINKDLCSQFSVAYKNLTGVSNAASSIKDIMNLFTSNPQAALLSLQQASIGAQQTANSTLAQMQMLQAQTQQRELAREKLQNQVGANTANTILTKSPGL